MESKMLSEKPKLFHPIHITFHETHTRNLANLNFSSGLLSRVLEFLGILCFHMIILLRDWSLKVQSSKLQEIICSKFTWNSSSHFSSFPHSFCQLRMFLLIFYISEEKLHRIEEQGLLFDFFTRPKSNTNIDTLDDLYEIWVEYVYIAASLWNPKF